MNNLLSHNHLPEITNEKLVSHMILAYIFLAGVIIFSIWSGASPLTYIIFALVAAVFILPSYYYLGLGVIFSLTMVFERFFTLQPLIIDHQIYKLYPLDIIIILIIIAWIINFRFGRQKPKLFFGAPEKILFFFLIAVGLYLVRGLFDPNSQFAITFSSFKNYAWYPLLYFIIVFSVQDTKKIKNFAHLILLNGAFILAFVVLGLVQGQGFWTQFTPLSTAGTRLLAGTHAFYLVLAFMIGISLWAFKRIKKEKLALAIMGLWLIGIIGSLMRHLWLSLAVALIFLYFFMPKENKARLKSYLLKIGLIIVAVISVIFLIANVSPTLNFAQSVYSPLVGLEKRIVSFSQAGSDTSVIWRLDLWNNAKNIWLTNPVVGVGFGKEILVESGNWQSFEEIRNMHNSPLAVLVQMGLVGSVLLFAFVALVIIKSWRYIFCDNELKPYYLGILGAIVALLVASLFQPYLETNLMGIFLWLLLGLLRTSQIIVEQKKSTQKPTYENTSNKQISLS
ncbi:MAG: O-antigen ligase family protein [Patescibacteria group bacterium]